MIRILVALLLLALAGEPRAQESVVLKIGRAALIEFESIAGKLAELVGRAGTKAVEGGFRVATHEAQLECARCIAHSSNPIAHLFGAAIEGESLRKVPGVLERIPEESRAKFLDMVFAQDAFWLNVRSDLTEIPAKICEDAIQGYKHLGSAGLRHLYLLNRYCKLFESRPSWMPEDVHAELWLRVSRHDSPGWEEGTDKIIKDLFSYEAELAAIAAQVAGRDSRRGYCAKVKMRIERRQRGEIRSDVCVIPDTRDSGLWNGEGTALESLMNEPLSCWARQWYETLSTEDKGFLCGRFLESNGRPRTRKAAAEMLQMTSEQVRTREDQLLRGVLKFLDDNDIGRIDVRVDSKGRFKKGVNILQAILYYTPAMLVGLDFDQTACSVAWGEGQ